MNKNLIAVTGLLLVGIIAYQAYLLGKKDALEQNEKKEPTITVTIDDEALEKESEAAKNTLKTAAASQAAPKEPLVDEEKIRDDLNRLFKDIFDNPKLKEEINKNLSRFQHELKEGINQFQIQMLKMTREFEKAAQNDTFLKDFFKNAGFAKTLDLIDKTDHYYLKTPPIADENSTIDINVKGNFMLISVKKTIVEQKSQNETVVKKELKKKDRILISLPEDADIQRLKTTYKDSSLEITIPKKKI